MEHPRIIMLSQNMISINYNTKYFIGQSMIFGKNLCVKSGSLDPFPYKSVDFFFNRNRKGGCINRLCTAIHYISEGRYIAGMAHKQQTEQSLFPKTENTKLLLNCKLNEL